jgi:hypothetical protein
VRCGGAQEHAVSPDAVDSSGSESHGEARATPDPTIQPASAPDALGSAAPAPAPPPDKAQPTSDLEARIISGAALPPSSNAAPSSSSPRPPKAKKPSKGRKKSRS